jgi:hypothetical protein
MQTQTRIGLAIALALFATASAEAAKRSSAPLRMSASPVASGAPAAAIGGAEFALPATKRSASRPVALPAPSAAELATFHAERQRGMSEGKALMIGFSRTVPGRGAVTLPALEWSRLSDGRLATRFEVSSADAASIRAELSLKARASDLRGTILRFGGNDGRVFQITGADFIGKASVWSPTMRGATGTIEIVLPKGRNPGHFQLGIPSLNHMDVDPLVERSRWAIPTTGGSSWACHLDTVCRTNPSQGFLNAQKAVAQMTYISGRSAYVCTGTLLNNSRVPKRALFWTAAHCIDTATEAATLETLWFFQTTACKGTAIAPGVVQVTGGANLVYANSTADTSLLELRQAPPFGAVYAGYNANGIAPTGTAIEGLHHPAGDTMMYALGSITGTAATAKKIKPLYSVRWSAGITEGGSSGSALFTVDASGNYELRGGLWGGGSTCTAPTASDYYSQLSGVWSAISAQF